MSTRCQVILKDSYGEVWFYRHSDGYPEGVTPTLARLCQWIKDGRIRNNAEQAAGWLVIIGREEYKAWKPPVFDPARKPSQDGPFEPGHDNAMSGWQVGAYEPCAPQMHGDIEHLYVVDLASATWKEAKSFDMDENTYEMAN